ncbi:MAG: 16S rRNA (guanine(966)-N(2))-methyltransferase RsmD [Solirubrobacterales bacterium]|nr:16S rRNA (guanine(966)-N(2))-methyltransferase RsmD [Solirubrobacterales bacterium]
MRIIAGTHGGRRIQVPAGTATRPTGERVREAVFSSLGDIAGFNVLDLFAGSGAFGLEAVSRGALGSVLVDSSNKAVTCIEANIGSLSLGGQVSVVKSDWRKALGALDKEGKKFDLVVVDPPWAEVGEVGPQLAGLLRPILAESATVVCESGVKDPMEVDLPLVREKRYGDTLIRVHGS